MGQSLLQGLRVLELTQWLPGPSAGQMLVDLGADVLKLEPPEGDPMRHLGPKGEAEVSRWYALVNAGKRVVRLDLKSAAGKEALAALIARADVLLESYRPGMLARLGFDRARLTELNPALVHCALSGYGQTGPLAQVAGHDVNYMALGGGLLRSGTAEAPVMAFPPTADHASALQAVVSLLAALLRRARTGEGAFLDISLMETVLAWQALPLAAAADPGEAEARGEGVLSGGAAFYNLYRTADRRFVSLGAIEPKFWRAFAEAVGHPEWVARQGEPLPQRALIAEVAALFAAQPLAFWVERLEQVDCCFMPLLEPEELVRHPQIAARAQLRAQPGAASPEILFAGWIDGAPPAPRRPLTEVTGAAALEGWL